MSVPEVSAACRKARSLLIAPVLPSDAGNGLAMRIGMFLQALCQQSNVEVIVLPMFGGAETTNPFCQSLAVRPRFVPVSERPDTQYLILRNLSDPQMRLDAFERFGKPSLAASLSIPVLRDIREYVIARQFDLVHIARSYLLPVVGTWPAAKRPKISIDLDEDDVETHRRIARLHTLRGDDVTGRWLEAEAVAFDRIVRHWLPQVDMAFISTEREREAVDERYGIRPIVAANGIAPPTAMARKPAGHELVFVGGFGYFPNLDGALWLLEAILPVLKDRSRVPVSMTLVGRNPTKQLCRLADRSGVTILDDVGDLLPIYERASIALVPLRAGGGSRIKLLEAAAYGVPIIVTSTGAENSGLMDGRDIWVADEPDAFVDACLTILTEPAKAARRAAAAKEFVETHYSRQEIISTIEQQFAEQIFGPAIVRGEVP